MASVYEIVTDQILERLDEGTVPWRKPWTVCSADGLPLSLSTKKPYRGINVFLLNLRAAAEGWESPWWVTFKQAQKLGGSVRKGSKSTLVVFWKWPSDDAKAKAKKAGRSEPGPMLRYFRVFNVAQCDGLDEWQTVERPERPQVDPIEVCEKIAAQYASGPDVEHGGGRACYAPMTDVVRMPERDRFDVAEEYYSVLFHELGHSTGHHSRLKRDGICNHATFASHEYSREELVAEMTAAFLCGVAGIEPKTLDNSAAYIASWKRALRGDPRAVVMAAAQAQKAADWIQGERRGLAA